MSAHLVFPAGAVYSGTKFAVRAITEGLRIEEASNNIRTTIISPGTRDYYNRIARSHFRSRIKICHS